MKIIENLISRYCPDGVEYVDLGEVVVFTDGHSFSSGSFTESGEYQVVKITDIFGGLVNRGKTFINELPEKLKNGQQLSGGEILVAMSGSTGKTGYNTLSNAVVNQRIAILRNQDCIENGYLKHLLVNGTFETYCFKNGTGPQNNISKAQLLRYRIPLPPLPIQQEIVRILDTFTNLTAELTNKLNAELTARRKQYEYYRDELLTFGEDVEYKKLGEVVSMKAGKAIKAQDIGEKNELFSIPCYGGNGLRGYVKDANCSGDKVLIGRQGALCGNVCFVSGEFYATEHAVVVSSDNNVDMRFLFHLLLKLNLNQYKTAGAQPGLSVSKLETVKVQIPSIEYQRRVSKVLDLFSRYIDNLEDGLPAEISARQKQYEYYRDQLLSLQKEKE